MILWEKRSLFIARGEVYPEGVISKKKGLFYAGLWGIIRSDFDGMAVVAGKGCSCIGILADEVVIETPWDDGFIQHHR
ncbi:MAG: hypothetical protein PF447_08730, partial [Spirochaetaceae bacterium]|nr:hypothetical protein [Spirochaetaceae bacterium]